jgi:gas vesicle protein
VVGIEDWLTIIRKGEKSMNDRDEFGAFLVGFVVGGLTGAVVALLFAPQSGEETRALIKDKSIELRDRAQMTAEEALARAEQVAAEARTRAEELTREARMRAEELAAEVRERGKSAVEAVRRPKKAETEGEMPTT